MKKLMTVILAILLSLVVLGGCSDATQTDSQNTYDLGAKLSQNQPTPTDVEYSLERYNLIRRAYWVNGQRDKAINLPSPVALPLGYVVLFNATSVVAQFTVEGKVSSLTNYLTPVSHYVGSGSYLPDTDGTYGDNPEGIYFFTTDGKYVEWNGNYLYSDLPIFVEKPIIIVK